MGTSIRKIKRKKPFRFGVTGAISTGLDIGTYSLLTLVGIAPIVSNFFSTAVGFCFSFFTNRAYTFKSSHQNMARQMLLFTVVTLFGLWVIQPIIIYMFEILYAQPLTWTLALVAKICATPITMVYNYILYSRLVFTSKD